MNRGVRLEKYQVRNDVLLLFGMVAILILLIVPLSGFFIDMLLSLSLLLSIAAFLVAFHASSPLDFHAFPSFLLCFTLFRLGLNIATTRSILTKGNAGEIVETFGSVVTAGEPFVGMVIFFLLTLVNFIVITKGAGRVAEVAARFTLDGMAGKQLAIESDLNSGYINENEARLRREDLELESDFYGAMDGASKFVRGDAIASVVIIFVNLLGGCIVGIFLEGMSWQEVVALYSRLTIGDGLVTQIPALLISVAAGIMVTRSSARGSVISSLKSQMFHDPVILFMSAAALLLLGMIPGMPFFTMAILAGGGSLLAYFKISEREALKTAAENAVLAGKLVENEADDVEKIFFIDPIELELAPGLALFLSEGPEELLLLQNSRIRKEIAKELGLVVPSIRVVDNPALPSESYLIKIRGNETAFFQLEAKQLLAVDSGNVTRKMLEGTPVRDPVSGRQAFWIRENLKKMALDCGYQVKDPLQIISDHLEEQMKIHASLLINRQEVANLIAHVRKYAAAVVDELIPLRLSLGGLLRVLQNLLNERVPIRDLVGILESLADHISSTQDPDLLSEYVRQGLGRNIARKYAVAGGLYAITLDPRLESFLLESLEKTELGKQLVVPKAAKTKILQEIEAMLDKANLRGLQPVCLTTAALRPYLNRLLQHNFPRMPVLSGSELGGDVEIHSLGTILPEVFIHDR